MASSKKLTDEELFAQFEGIDDDTNAPANKAGQTSKRPPTASKVPPQPSADDDALAELENLAKAKVNSRPNTPRIASAAGRTRGQVGDTSLPSNRSSDEHRKSTESNRSNHQAFTPASTSDGSPNEDLLRERLEQQQGGGGWFGSIWSTASAVRKQAENAVKEIQKNEEAQKWMDNISKGKLDVNTLKGLAADLQKRGQGTFTSILQTIAPPISQHERLLIHITHDFLNYPSLDPTIYATFSRVMAQVEGGDLLVIQRGADSTPRRTSSEGYRGSNLSMSSSGGWTDGPWWRQGDAKRDIGIVKGLPEGTKLARVSAETYATEFFSSKGGVEEVAKQATQVLSESNPVRSSDIFLSIQAVSYTQPADLFGTSNTAQSPEKKGGVEEPKEETELLCFAVYLHDPMHAINFATLSQSFPAKWINWLDAEHLQVPDPSNPNQTYYAPPEDIAQIIDEGGVDPREWVAEWVEESLSLGVGTVAQRYVARRMGVGEGGIGRGKAREAALEAGAGEIARAVGGL